MSIKIKLRTEFCESMSDYYNDDSPMKVNFQPNMDKYWVRFSYHGVADVRLLYLVFILKV